MQPAVPDEPQRVWASADEWAADERAADERPAGGRVSGDAPEVGAYRQGTPGSRAALARYLVGRVIAESVGTTLYLVALVLALIAVGAQLGLHATVLAVLVALVAVIVLLVRAGLLAILRRLTAAAIYGPISDRLSSMVKDTHRDVRRELRRLGLPSHTLTLPLLALRLAGRRRRATLEQLRGFDLDRAVPPARVDELHLLIGSALGRNR